MYAPIRALVAFRPRAAPGLLVGAAVVSAVFSATPFLVPAVSDHYEVALGSAGLISVAQVGGFMVANLVAGRRIRPAGWLLQAAAGALVAANLASAFAGWFGLLLIMRVIAGVAAGMVTWLAWIDAMREHAVMRDIAGIGPLTALVVAPLLGWVASAGGDRALFLLLGGVAAVPLLFPVRISSAPLEARRRVSPSRSNVVLLVAMAVLTAAGSSFFIFTAAMAEQEMGLHAVAVSAGFSINAAAGLAATRFRAPAGTAWIWLSLIALSILGMTLFSHPAAFYAGMAAWGFAFWMAIPEVLRQVAAWSLAPEERVGDAQGLMAFGRMLGPAMGGALVGSGSFVAVGMEAAVGTSAAAAVVATVERYRRDRRGPRAWDGLPAPGPVPDLPEPGLGSG